MDNLYDKLLTSSLFGIYEKAFREATGLPLAMVPAGGAATQPHGPHPQHNPFCRLLEHAARGTCAECVRSRTRLLREAGAGMRTITCFAGLQETVVPVRLGRTVVAYLKTWQVCHRKPTARGFRKAMEKLGDRLAAADLGPLKAAYLQSPVVAKERYDAAVTLLAAFSLQLGSLANRIAISETKAEPPVVARAKAFVESRLNGELCLGEVAAHVRVSRFYFCKIFKQSTGMTLTEFIGRRRVEQAKDLLLRTDARVIEIAFSVGFQSLSQFNRSFVKFAGESPTEYRAKAAQSAA